MSSRPSIILAVLALTTLIAAGWISDHSTRVMSSSIASLDRTRDVLLAIDLLRASVAEAESSGRGHMIADLPSYLITCERAVHSARQHQSDLKDLLAGDAQHRASLAALDSLIDRRIRLFRELIALGHTQQQLPQIRQNVIDGTNASRRINEVLNAIRAKELDRFRRQSESARSAQRYALIGPWVMCGIAVMLFVLLAMQVAATLRRNEEARAILGDAVVQEHAAATRARETDNLKNQFLAAVSHELRTPLTSILGWCQLLDKRMSNHALVAEGLSSIAQAARTQSHLVEDLLDVSRITAGKLKLCPADVDPAGVIEKAVNTLAPVALAKGVAVHTCVEGAPPSIVADPTRMEQILNNLLSNAIKFTPAGGTIVVTLWRTPSHMVLSVRDDGEGIERELLPHIFDRFRQGRSAITRQAGLGLGLSIVKHLVELHGGAVRAASDGPGKGATFVVELPVGALVAETELAMEAASMAG